MYEERVVDVASYVCKNLDQMPTSPGSPMYVDWWWPVCWTEYGSATIWCTYSTSQNLTEVLLNYKSYFEMLISVMRVLFQSTDASNSFIAPKCGWGGCIQLLLLYNCQNTALLLCKWFCSVWPQYIGNLFCISVLRNKNITEDKTECFFSFSKMKELVNGLFFSARHPSYTKKQVIVWKEKCFQVPNILCNKKRLRFKPWCVNQC